MTKKKVHEAKSKAQNFSPYYFSILENIKQTYLSKKEVHSLILEKGDKFGGTLDNHQGLYVAFYQHSLSYIMLKHYFTLAKEACDSSCCDLIRLKVVKPSSLSCLISPTPPSKLMVRHKDTNRHICTASCIHNDELLDTLVIYLYRDMFRDECHLNHTHINIHTGT